MYSLTTLEFDYKSYLSYISVLGYFKESLQKYQNHTTDRQQHSYHQCNSPNYESIVPQIAHQI